MANKKIALASVLAFEKKLVPSDGFLYGTSWEKRQTEEEPIALIEKSVRGTISNRLKAAVKNDPMKLNAEVEKANLQTVDSASLKLDQDTLKLRFTLKVLSGVQHPSVCNEEEHGRGISKMVEDYIEESGFSELAHRYATKIASGRFFWRNRVGAEKVEVIVRVKPSGETMTFDGYDYSLKNFDKHSPDLDQLSARIADALCGRISYLLLEIEACVLMGHGQEVYPSEELILDKGYGKKMKVDRSKGLGENEPDMMWLTTMNPETRRLIRVMPEDAERTAQVFDLLLGDNLQGRKDHIAENGYKYLELADIS